MTARTVGTGGRAPRRRLRWALALASCGALGLSAGCAGLPHESGVMSGQTVGAPLSTPIGLHPVTPIPGSAPDVIVRDFIAAGSALSTGAAAPAGATVSKDFRPAREFLTPGVSEGWAPSSRPVVLYSGPVQTRVVSADEATAVVRASVRAVATLATDGRYVELPDAQDRPLDVTLAKTDGEWRVTRLPDDFGLWLDVFYFNRSYQPFSVTYASPTARTLIPDRRFFPITSALPTALARAQLGPIPDYLKGAVTSGFPADARLSVEAVPIQGGTAQLDVTMPTASTAEDRRSAMAQAIATLTQASSVAGVTLQTDGKPLSLVGVAGPPYDLAGLGYEKAKGSEPDLVVVRNGARLTAVRPAELHSTDGTGSAMDLPAVDPAFSKLAVAAGLRDIAAVSADGSTLYRFRQTGDSPAVGRSAQLATVGTQLVRPAFDTRQGLWLAGVAPSGAPTIWVIDTRGELGLAQPVPVAAPWLAGPARRRPEGRTRRAARRPAAAPGRRARADRRERGAAWAGPAGLRAHGAPVRRSPARRGGRPRLDLGVPAHRARARVGDLGPAGHVRRPRRPGRGLRDGGRAGGAHHRLPRRRPRRRGERVWPPAHLPRRLVARPRPGHRRGRALNRRRRPSRSHCRATGTVVHSAVRRRRRPQAPRPAPGGSGRFGHARPMGWWRDAMGEALDLALPTCCAGCGRPGRGWCLVCRAEVATAWGGVVRRVAPAPTPRGFPPTWAAAPYDGPLRHALAAYKDDGRRDLVAPLAAELARALAAALDDLVGSDGTRTGAVWVVPVPSSPQARRRRGDAPFEAVARRAVAALGAAMPVAAPGAAMPVAAPGAAKPVGALGAADPWALRCVPRALRVSRRLADQAGLSTRQRSANLAGAHAADPAVRGRAVVVVDDVVTSGATLTEAARALRAAGAERVAAASIAATTRRGGRAV